VEVFLRTPLPFLPQLGKVVLNLEHKMEVISTATVYACVLVCAHARDDSAGVSVVSTISIFLFGFYIFLIEFFCVVSHHMWSASSHVECMSSPPFSISLFI
jgi:hypothetical protein